MSKIKVKIEKTERSGEITHTIRSITNAVLVFGINRSYSAGESITDLKDLQEIASRGKYQTTITFIQSV